MTKHFKPAFRQEVAEIVLDKGYSIRETAETMSVGKSTVDTLLVHSTQNAMGRRHQARHVKIRSVEREVQRLKTEKNLKKSTVLLMLDSMNGLR